MSFVATGGGGLTADRAHAQDGSGLRELPRAGARFDVEREPRDGVAAGRGRGGFDRADHLAAVAAFPGRTAVVLADGLAPGVGKFGLGTLECPRVGAGVV